MVSRLKPTYQRNIYILPIDAQKKMLNISDQKGHANPNYNEILSHSNYEVYYQKKRQMTSTACEENESLTAGRSLSAANAETAWRLLNKTKARVSTRSSNPTIRHTSKRCEISLSKRCLTSRAYGISVHRNQEVEHV